MYLKDTFTDTLDDMYSKIDRFPFVHCELADMPEISMTYLKKLCKNYPAKVRGETIIMSRIFDKELNK